MSLDMLFENLEKWERHLILLLFISCAKKGIKSKTTAISCIINNFLVIKLLRAHDECLGSDRR